MYGYGYLYPNSHQVALGSAMSQYALFRDAVWADGGTIYDEVYSFGLFFGFFDRQRISQNGATLITGMPASKEAVLYGWDVQNQALVSFAFTRAGTKWTLRKNGNLGEWPANFPAFEWNADGTYRGLSVEPGATNQIRNNTMQGAAVGAPGTLPTNWSGTFNGLTREVVAIGVENGVEYIDLRFHGTATGTTVDVAFEGSVTQVVATPSQVWAVSLYSKIVDNTLPPVNHGVRLLSYTSGGGFITSSGGANALTTQLARYEQAITTSSDPSTARAFYVYRAVIVSGQSYDFTIRIGFPQMETGSVATSVIRTTNATANRVADSVTLTGASSLIGQSAGTMYVESEPKNNLLAGWLLMADGGNEQNRLLIVRNGTTSTFSAISTVANVGQCSINTSGSLTGIQKMAFAYATDDFAFYINGASIGTDTSGTVPTTSNIRIGVSSGAGAHYNGWIRSVALFPTRLTNAQLQALTTP